MMQRLGIGEEFTRWVKLLFGNASTAINLNGSLGNSIKIKRRIR